MDVQGGSAERGDRQVRVLLLYVGPEQGASLVKLLPSERYELVSCQAAAVTERWVDELQPDLVLLAPPADQRQLLRVCEDVRVRTDAPVVVLSELGEELLVTRALAAGIDEYLVLPMGGRELVARIEALLRRMRRQHRLSDTRRVGGLLLCSADHSVVRDGRKIFLSPIEFRLLTCLASSPGKVLTHQTLMSRVWGAEYVDSRHYLRLYVRYLREKLEDDPTSPRLIVSEWGVGYRLELPAPSGDRTRDRPPAAPARGATASPVRGF